MKIPKMCRPIFGFLLKALYCIITVLLLGHYNITVSYTHLIFVLKLYIGNKMEKKKLLKLTKILEIFSLGFGCELINTSLPIHLSKSILWYICTLLHTPVIPILHLSLLVEHVFLALRTKCHSKQPYSYNVMVMQLVLLLLVMLW